MEVEEGDYDGEEDDGLEAEEEEEEEEEGEEEEVSLLILCRYGLQWNLSNNGHQWGTFSEVSSFRNARKSGTWGGKRCPV